MIPAAHITQWRANAPWQDDIQVEQDLILSRIIVEIFSDQFLKKELAFRGGTALHKLFFSPPARYSEDIDLVRTNKGAIKDIIDALRNCLVPWLDEPRTKRTSQSFKMIFYFSPENMAISRQRIKIEINIQESFSILERLSKNFLVQSNWFSGSAEVNTFQLEELIATKIRALYQRSKGRDVFDVWLALKDNNLDIEMTVKVFKSYMQKEGKVITQELYENNLNSKLKELAYLQDIENLLSQTFQNDKLKPYLKNNTKWDLFDAAQEIKNKLFIHLP